MMKKLVFLLISILAGCSSPPVPTPAQFEKANEVINPSLPYVPDFHGVIKSEVSGKGWVYEITSLSGVQARTPTFYYALAHADRVVVTTHDAGLWFRIRDLLKMEGATAVVEWRNEKSFLPEQVKIVFIKAQNEVKNDWKK
ncbi:cag pathogenicity island Cag12 family protein [Escherichia coli]|uniref:cag pathogenicity island Cag12 family protein n=1 Tax=Escherichia coli TaxID=562 RepID=UPI001E30A89C|nr:cag pathogenicity island Cag12 family protein [Escherichia coli]MCE3906366.1 cag pathogenicity island Cag12 family protein [Escherichia coli]